MLRLRPGSLWRQTDFRRLWAGETVSLVGSHVTILAVPLTAVTLLHATPWQLGLLGAAGWAPYLLVGLPAGLWVDRHPRRPTLVVSNLAQAALLGLVPLLAALHRLALPALVGIVFAAGVFRLLADLAWRAYLPSVVADDGLTEANAKLSASESLAEIGGPGLGGWLVQLVGAPFAVAADALSFLLAAANLGRIRIAERLPTVARRGLRREVAEGFRFAFTNPYLRAFAGEAASYNLCWQAVETLLVVFAVRELGMRPATLGLVLAVGSAGALLGALTTGPAARAAGTGRTMIAAAVVGDAAPLAIPLVGPGRAGALVLAAAFFVRGIGITGCNVHVYAIRQAITPDHLRGRTLAAYQLLVAGVIPLGALVGGFLGGRLGLRPTLLLATIGLLSTAFWLIASPVRKLERPPPASAEAGPPREADRVAAA